MDHLVHTLVTDVIRHYQNRHYRQNLKLEGSDLAEKCLKEIHTRTPEIKADAIRDLGDNHYYVQSLANPSLTYVVELSTQKCDCADWPRVELCKHVTAVAHFFGNVDQQSEELEDILETAQRALQRSESPGTESSVRALSIVENLVAASQEYLGGGAPSSPGTICNLKIVETHFTATVQKSRSSESPLPDKEIIPPNQGTEWTETVKRMGAKQRQRPRPTSSSPPEASATELIGALNRKRKQITDPYSGGVHSGKHAAPDAQTASQNAEARARAAAASEPLLHPPKRARKCAPPPSEKHPSQSLEPHHMHATITSAPSPPAHAYPYYPGVYTHVPYVPYQSAYPIFWPYTPFQSYHRTTQ